MNSDKNSEGFIFWRAGQNDVACVLSLSLLYGQSLKETKRRKLKRNLRKLHLVTIT